MNPPSSKLLGCAFCGWLCLFGLSYCFVSRVPDVLGNRILTPFPSRPAGMPDSAWLQNAAAWAIDHSPFRMETIIWRNHALLTLAGSLQPLPANPGNSAVSMGRGGWLFLLEEAPGFRSLRDLTATANQAVALAKSVAASGRRFYFLPIPDKSSIYPEYTGTVQQWADRKSRREMLPALLTGAFAAEPDLRDCFVPLWGPLMNAKSSARGLLYWEHDTHWNPEGVLCAVQVLVEHLKPGLWDPFAVKPQGISEHHGDLMKSFLLQPVTTSANEYAIVRPGPQPVRVELLSPTNNPLPPIARYRCSQPNVIKGRTLFISDSCIALAVPYLTPWFEDVTFAHFDYSGSEELARRISLCDTLILTSVERLLEGRLRQWSTRKRDYLLNALARPRDPNGAPAGSSK